MKNWSIPAGNIFGIELRVHLSFVALLAVVWLVEGAASGANQAFRVLALVALVFGSVVIHEIAHALVALHHGVGVRSITLLPLGGVTQLEDSSQRNLDPKREMRIAVAGPIVNVVLGVFVGTGLLLFFPQVNIWGHPYIYSGNLLRSFVWGNLLLGAFNLLPAYPLDGGRVLRALFATRMDWLHATRRAVTVGQIFATIFVLVGALTNIWLVIIGLFLFFGGQMEDRSAVFHSVLENVKMEDVMLTDFKTLSPADTLEDALHKAVHSLQDDFPVVRGSDMVGVISRQRILDALRNEGNGYVQSAMNKVFQVAQRSETLASVFRKVGQKGLSVVPVVEGEHLVGIVTLQNLMHSMAVLAESRRLQQES
jgi:Zn-dependent protease/predicted transcriptional regulator